MAQIAAKAGVAKSTVSMALKNDPRISAAQRERIQGIAESMGYQTNALLARLMAELRKTRKQKYVASLAAVSLAVKPLDIYRRIHNMNSWMTGFERRAEQLGYSIDHFWIGETDMRPERLARILEARNVQGVIFHGVWADHCVAEVREIWTKFPSVVIGVHLREPPLNFVLNDHYDSAVHACRKLAEAGYRRIGIVLDRWLDNVLEGRYISGYFAALGHSASALPPLFLEQPEGAGRASEGTRLSLREQFEKWLRAHRPDACICVNSYLLEWLRDFGMSVPEKMGFALLDLPGEFKGEIAGMDPRSLETGMKTVDVLIAQIHRGEYGIPEIQCGTMIENTWAPGKTVREPGLPTKPRPNLARTKPLK